MEPEQIVRRDFPTVRKGWDPEAVRAHLEQIADTLPTRPASLSEEATERVGGIVAAAEASAAEIEADARRRADTIVAEARAEARGLLELAEASIHDADESLTRARSEAEDLLARARADARARVDAAQTAVESLLSKAEDLRGRVGLLGQSLVDDIRDGVGDAVQAVVRREPEPTVDREAAPGADLGPVPEAEAPEGSAPEPVPAPPEAVGPTEPVPAPPEAVGPPEPVPAPPAAVEREGGTATPSTEELVAQLRDGSTAGAAQPQALPEASGAGRDSEPLAGDDAASIRLVAMNLALSGADRDAIAEQIRTEFGEVEDADQLIGEVLARAGRG